MRSSARRIAALGLALLGAGPLIAQPATVDNPAAGPRAVVDEPVFDFGPIAHGETVRHDFFIRNAGDYTLRLGDVRSSCGCTVVQVDEQVSPGQAGRVGVEIDSREQTGAFAVYVDVSTNDPTHPRLKLTLKAELQRRVRARPGYLRLLAYRGAEAGRSSRHHIWATDGGELTVLRVDSPYPFLEAAFRRAAAEELVPAGPEAQWIVETRLVDDAPTGELRSPLVIAIEHPVEEELRIPVLGFVHDAVVAEPSDLFFGEVSIGGGVESSVELTLHADERFELTGAESSVPGVAVELVPVGEDWRTRRLMVRLTPNLLTGRFEGVVRVMTTRADLPVLTLPLSGTSL